MPLPINVSPTAMQMLAVIVDRNPADMATLLECVRQPEDVIAWVNELQTLLDHELVVRGRGVVVGVIGDFSGERAGSHRPAE